MSDHRPGGVIASIRAQAPSLQPTERAVANVLLQHSSEIVELTSQQVADLAGASRPTVVRTCQSLGFSGYQQLRVLIARDAVAANESPVLDLDGSAAVVAGTFAHVRESVSAMTALLNPADVDRAVIAIAEARRVVLIGNGFSAPVAADAAARMSGIGRPAEVLLDAIGQQVTARQLSAADVLLVVSGSGANRSTMQAAIAAHEAGATVVLLTSFSHSPLVSLADITLVVGMPDLSFKDEITVTTRIPQVILLEGLVAALTIHLGDVAAQAKSITLEVVSDNLAE
ncbi:RpiR family transcriptional regulator [Antricoccus suffuscus]|uniref:RpiR family transcriptional regulator n=1 Tax=Antricoccus suffuscus TaxID=1629062 RepID=A0A2T0ZWA5_9ACTN|nr:MurR/RpiR family transcriptional regulator [Antricoccus suffuscus]PRZ40537.1 RpiR family transcriptional regulator [Antricoccus suffuscus]